MSAISDECDLRETAARLTIRARESNFKKRQLSIQARGETGFRIRLKSQKFKAL